MDNEWYSNWECSVFDIICPYCGKRYDPTYGGTYIGGRVVDFYEEGDQGEFTCDECGKRFKLSTEIKWEYTTETIDGEMTEEEHDFTADLKEEKDGKLGNGQYSL